MKKLKIFLTVLLTLCVALCVCFVAACTKTDDDENKGNTGNPPVVGPDDPDNPDKPDPDKPDPDKPEDTEGKTKENPIVISAVGNTRASVPAGTMLYFKVTAEEPEAGKVFTVSSRQTKASFACGTNTGNNIELTADENGEYYFTLAISDGTATTVLFSLTITSSSNKGESEANPIDIMDNGEFEASVAAGATVYYRLAVKDAVAESEVLYYTIFADNDKAVFTCGDATGADIRLTLSSDDRYHFSVTTSDGSAADFKFTVKLNAPLGNEYNPYIAEVYDGTPETLYNNFHFEAAGDTVHTSFVADKTGFYVISSDCEYVTLTGGYGFSIQPDETGKTGAFKLVAYVKEGESFSFGAMLSDSFGGDVADVKFSLVYDEENGDGTENNPYALHIGDICRFMMGMFDDPVYVKVVDGEGNAVAARLFAPNTSADFGNMGSSYNVNEDTQSVAVSYLHGTPTFIVDEAE